MIDPRMTRLADVLINYSTEMKSGEKILIEAIDVPHDITCELIRMARRAGAEPLVTLKSNHVLRSLLTEGSEEQLKLIAETEAVRMKQAKYSPTRSQTTMGACLRWGRRSMRPER